jgi:hypothetical protein
MTGEDHPTADTYPTAYSLEDYDQIGRQSTVTTHEDAKVVPK